MRRRTAWAGAAIAALALPMVSSAERAWMKDEVRLNVRTGAGSAFRILGAVKTGDALEVLNRGDGWTQVRGEAGLEGWIPSGYLQSEPPARIQLERHIAETGDMRGRYERISREVEELRAQNEGLSAADEKWRGENEVLRKENLELRAGARWPEWIAGASILCTGAILGIFVHMSAGRRSTRRIRL